jgi:ribosomal protein S18 acetylase RimI-like enzyme
MHYNITITGSIICTPLFVIAIRQFVVSIAAEIVGCCEVIEERLDISQQQRPFSRSERERRKTARRRPVIENLCVKRGYRRCGVGAALVRSCEGAVRRWGQDEVFTQVDDDNTDAYNLFSKCGYRCLFSDPTCTRVVLDGVLFAKEVAVTKRMLRKILN